MGVVRGCSVNIFERQKGGGVRYMPWPRGVVHGGDPK